MCGIVGVFAQEANGVETSKLRAMTERLSHRGPDGSGLWISTRRNLGLGHRRLAILDTSEAGAQPMSSPNNRYILVFNGEIYNFEELRVLLSSQGFHFSSDSDTEVVLAAFEAWGIAETLIRLNGMFALAVWDQQDDLLFLARDRVGIKPLYVLEAQDELVFASELRPIVFWNGVLPSISKEGLSEYLRLGYVPGPLSIFEGVTKLEPGHVMTIKNGQVVRNDAYWSLEEIVRRGMCAPISDAQLAQETLEAQLSRSVSRHMVSDVPLGAFLSGGIDSSTIVALMQAQSTQRVKTYSIGFEDELYNEAPYAVQVAKHLGTDHTELYVTENDALEIVPKLATIYDEPFADVSQIPTYAMSELTKRHVTVALSGDGGDELFAGYNRHIFTKFYWSSLEKVPITIRKLVSLGLGRPSVSQWNKLFSALQAILPNRIPSLPGQKMHKISEVVGARTNVDLYHKMTTHGIDPKMVLSEEYSLFPTSLMTKFDEIENIEPAIQQTVWDMNTYLVDDVLTKVDRASMHVGLETRVPFLDHELVELAFRFAPSLKLDHNSGKWLLKSLLYKYVPEELFVRPKMGFSVPIDSWLRGSLREFAEDLLDPETIAREGYLNNEQVQAVFQAHKDQKTDDGESVWVLLMFQLWLKEAKTWLQ